MRQNRKRFIKNRKFKKCPFCQEKKSPYFLDVDNLKKFVSVQGKILPRTLTGVCAKHQRRLSREIKRARILALLPFTQPKSYKMK